MQKEHSHVYQPRISWYHNTGAGNQFSIQAAPALDVNQSHDYML